MRTAIDTNVLIDVLARSGKSSDEAIEALLVAAGQGELILSVICYAEIAHRFPSRDELTEFLDGLQINVVDLTADHAFAAGTFHQAYRKRGGTRQRILPDFLVGAHALADADRLLTTDGRFYGPSFPALKAISPRELLKIQPGSVS